MSTFLKGTRVQMQDKQIPFRASDVELAYFTSITFHCQYSVTWLHLAAREEEISFFPSQEYAQQDCHYGRTENGFEGSASGLSQSPVVLLPTRTEIL